MPNNYQMDIQVMYDEYYYKYCCGEDFADYEKYRPLFEHIADNIVSEIHPSSTLDAGCAMGYLVHTLRERGVEAYGFDISTHAIESASGDVKPYVRVASILEPLPRNYDLITCFEIVEHLEKAESVEAIRNLCQYTSDILFSSTPYDYKEATHFNVRPIDYWATLFAMHGFYRDLDFDASFAFPWAVRFRKRNEPFHRVIGEYERKFREYQQEATAQRTLALEERIKIENLQNHTAQLEDAVHDYPALLANAERARDQAEARVDFLEAELTRKGQPLDKILAQKEELERDLSSWQDRAIEAETTLTQLRNTRAIRTISVWWRIKNRRAANKQTRGARSRHLLRAAARTLRQQGPIGFTRRLVRWLRGERYNSNFSLGSAGHLDIARRYKQWIDTHEPDAAGLDHQRRATREFAYRPLISVVMAVYNPPVNVLREAIQSVLDQTYDHWELCITNAGKSSSCTKTLNEFARQDSRIQVTRLDKNLGISENSNFALGLARGEFVALVDHDDTLAPFALYAMAEALNSQPDLDILYSDEDRLTIKGQRTQPFMKPDWSPELLHSFMYVGHLTVYRTSLITAVGGFRKEFDGSQDYDLILRATERTNKIHHIQQVLYHWRMIPTSAAAGAKSYARKTNIAASESAMARRGYQGEAIVYPYSNRFKFAFADNPMVSIVIPTDDLHNISACLQCLSQSTRYPAFEVIVVTNSAVADAIEGQRHSISVRCVRYDGLFNFSLKCNLGAQAAQGQYYIFLNDDVEPLSKDWIETLLEYARQPEIGGASPKLLYPDNTIQYAGLVTGVRDLVGTAFHKWDRFSSQYSNMAISTRDVSTLCGACMMVRADFFWSVAGWDKINTPIANSDFDISFKIRDLGLRLVYTPFAEMRHIGHQSIGKTDKREKWAGLPPYDTSHLYMLNRWGQYMSRDPYFPENMRAMVYHEDSRYAVYAPPQEPVRDWSSLRRILLVSHDLTLSGAPIILFEIARFLKSAGCFVAVIAPEEGRLLVQYQAEQIPVIIDPHIMDDPRGSKHLFGPFDVIVSNTILGWGCVQQSHAMGKPCVWLIHESEFGHDYIMQQPRQAHEAFSVADTVIFPAELTLRLYKGFARAKPFRAIHYGIGDVREAPAPPAPFKREPGKLYLGHVGSVEPRKGQDVLIKSLQRLPSNIADRVEAYFIGRYHDPEYTRQVKKLAEHMPHVHFVGEVPREQVLSYMRHMDVFVCTSREETGPIVVFEAMALEKAVISTKVGAASEMITSGQNGYLIDIDDADALARAIESFIKQPDQVAALGIAARETYESNLTLDRYGGELLKVFAAVMGGSPLASRTDEARPEVSEGWSSLSSTW